MHQVHEAGTKAHQEIWAAMLTLHGAQKSAAIGGMDFELRDRNRRTWNRWVAGSLAVDLRNWLIDGGSFSAEDLTPLSDMEKAELYALLADRLGAEVALPDPATPVNLTGRKFTTVFDTRGYLFPAGLDISGATFVGTVDFSRSFVLGDLEAEGARFRRNAFFNRAVVDGRITLHGSAFDGAFDASQIQTAQAFRFGGATVTGEARLSAATIHGQADFRHADFRASTDFAATRFMKDANFVGAAFGATANFHGVNVAGEASMQRARFQPGQAPYGHMRKPPVDAPVQLIVA